MLSVQSPTMQLQGARASPLVHLVVGGAVGGLAVGRGPPDVLLAAGLAHYALVTGAAPRLRACVQLTRRVRRYVEVATSQTLPDSVINSNNHTTPSRRCGVHEALQR